MVRMALAGGIGFFASQALLITSRYEMPIDQRRGICGVVAVILVAIAGRPK
jgi:hypothetical protein